MARQSFPSLPSDLKVTCRRFEEWRKGRKGRSRIPDDLWFLAISAARTHGVWRASKILGLDYMRLKQRVQTNAPPKSSAAFMEVDLSRSIPSAECTIEMQERDGAKMTVHLKGSGSVDLIGLSGAFFGRGR
jgi:hypothetical protein